MFQCAARIKKIVSNELVKEIQWEKVGIVVFLFNELAKVFMPFSFMLSNNSFICNLHILNYCLFCREEEAVNRGNTLYVTGLSSRVTEREIKDYFSKEGRVS